MLIAALGMHGGVCDQAIESGSHRKEPTLQLLVGVLSLVTFVFIVLSSINCHNVTAIVNTMTTDGSVLAMEGERVMLEQVRSV